MKSLYSSLYTPINMNAFPGETVMPGSTVASQAENAGYQDIPRDIQAMREAAYQQEVKRGEFSPEFSGLGVLENPRNLWIAVAALAGAAWLLCRKCKCK